MKYLPNSREELGKYWVIDLETDDIDASIIWCAVAKNVGTGEKRFFKPPNTHSDIRSFVLEISDRGEYLVNHNMIGFDLPVINDLLNLDFPVSCVIDTMVMSYLWFPSIPGGHSLKAWGQRLSKGNKDSEKIEFHDFSRYTDDMLTYCERDVDLTCRLFLHLLSCLGRKGFSETSLKIEHNIADVIRRQRKHGFYMNRYDMVHLYRQIRREERECRRAIQELFPPVLKEVATYEYKTRKDGQPYQSYIRHCEKYPKVTFNSSRTEYTVYDWQTFNLGSPIQRIERLKSYGWVPTNFTKKGNPQVDEASLVAFSKEKPEIAPLARWITLNGRGNMIRTWYKAMHKDDRIRGFVLSCGAATRRMTHNSPNTANIPGVGEDVVYGREARSLWTVPSGRVLVGYDASGLEMRCFGHYLNNPTAIKLYTEGDPHTDNTLALGLDPKKDRKNVKTAFYGFLYGAFDPKLGSVFRKDAKYGSFVRDTLIKNTPGLEDLISVIQREARSGWIQTIDGGYVRAPKNINAALNYKLQSAGVIAMKLAAILLDIEVRKSGWDAHKVGDIHDEAQWECYDPSIADALGREAVRSIERAGEYLGFNCPLTGEYIVGQNWAETH